MDPERTQDELAREKGEALRREMAAFEIRNHFTEKPFTDRLRQAETEKEVEAPNKRPDAEKRILFDQVVRDAQERQREREL